MLNRVACLPFDLDQNRLLVKIARLYEDGFPREQIVSSTGRDKWPTVKGEKR